MNYTMHYLRAIWREYGDKATIGLAFNRLKSVDCDWLMNEYFLADAGDESDVIYEQVWDCLQKTIRKFGADVLLEDMFTDNRPWWKQLLWPRRH
jgi:hypothetical protein